MKKITLQVRKENVDKTVDLMDKTVDYEQTLWLMSVAAIEAEYHSLIEHSKVETLWYNNDPVNMPDEVSFSVQFEDGMVLTKSVMRE